MPSNSKKNPRGRGREGKRPNITHTIAEFCRGGILAVRLIDTTDNGPQPLVFGRAEDWHPAEREEAAAWLAEMMPDIVREKFRGKRESKADAAYRVLFHERWPHERTG